MKALSFIVLLVVLSVISTLNYYTSNDPGSSIENSVDNTYSSLDKSGIGSAAGSTIYKVTAELNNYEKRITVSSSICVYPEDPDGADTLFFFLGVNDVATNSELNNSASQNLNSFNNFDIDKSKLDHIDHPSLVARNGTSISSGCSPPCRPMRILFLFVHHRYASSSATSI